MGIDRKQLKRQAKERIAAADPKFWLVAMAYLVMTTGVAWLISLVLDAVFLAGGGSVPGSDTVVLFFQLLLRLYTTVVQFGLCLWALWTYRKMDPDISSLMQGFSVAGRVLLMELGIFLRILGAYLLAALVLSLPFAMVLAYTSSPNAWTAAMLLYLALLLVVVIAASLRYALAPYLLADRPDDGPILPIRRSSVLMRGWKKELFKLELSFLGYELIDLFLSGCVIFFFLRQAGLLVPSAALDPLWLDKCLTVIWSTPAVILSSLVTVPVRLWLIPYRSVARAGFYDARIVAMQDEEIPIMMPPV